MKRLLATLLIPLSIQCSEFEPTRVPKYLQYRRCKNISAMSDSQIDALYHELAVRSFILHVTGVLDEITPPKPDKNPPRPPFPFKQICDTACPQVAMRKYYTLFGK